MNRTRISARRRGHYRTACIILICGYPLVSCGYKTPPSPVFDEGERFRDQIDERRKSDEQEARTTPPASERIYWTLPAPSPTVTPQPDSIPATKNPAR